jgi:hypothetical protein
MSEDCLILQMDELEVLEVSFFRPNWYRDQSLTNPSVDLSRSDHLNRGSRPADDFDVDPDCITL